MEPPHRDISHIQITAVLAVIVLAGIGAWQIVEASQAKSRETAFVAAPEQENGAQNAVTASSSLAAYTDPDPIAAVSTDALGQLFGEYEGLQASGAYSTSTADTIAANIGMGLSAPVTYPQLELSDIPTSPDTSYQAMLTYRAALQTAMKPLLQNTQPEYTLFAMYVESQDPTYLNELSEYAATYEAVASSSAQITVPADAAQVQLGLVNSMDAFAAVLNALVAHANDPIASSVLLENYETAQSDLLNAFQALVTYEQSKTQ